MVVSEGKGRDWLEAHKAQEGADNVILLDFQPYGDLPEMMASADLLVAVLEPDVSKFSVPSKVLTYLCSSRAVLGVLPPDNSVAEILTSQEAGVVVDPSDRRLVVKEAAALLDDPERRRDMGRAGRRYAERTFSPETAADQFLGAFGDLVADPHPDPAGAGLAGGTTR